MGPGGAVALNFLAVNQIMTEIFEIDADERKEFYEKVRRVSNEVLEIQYKDQEARAKAKK